MTSYWPPSAGATTLSSLTDVSFTSITNFDIIRFNGSSGKWENIPPPSRTLTAGATGCHYTTIQAAINAAVAAGAGAATPWTIECYGNFTENITLATGVWVRGNDYGGVRITGTVDGSAAAGGLQNVTVVITPNADGFVGIKVGDCSMFRVVVICNWNGDYTFTPVEMNGSTLGIFNECLVQLVGSATNTTKDADGLRINGTGAQALFGTSVVMYSNALSGNHCLVKVASGCEISAQSCLWRYQQTNAAFAGTARGRCCSAAGTGSNIREFNNCNTRLLGAGTGTAYGFYMDAGGVGATIQDNGCTLYYNNFATDGLAYTAAGDFQFIRTLAVNRAAGEAGAGTALIAPYDFPQTGRKAWVDSGAYYSASGTTFTVLRGGVGYIRSTPRTWAKNQSVTLTAHTTGYVYVDLNGTLQITTSATEALYQDNMVLFQVLYDGTNHLVVREDHPNQFPMAVSLVWHRVFTTLISGAGAVISRRGSGTGGSTTDREINITGGAKMEDHGLTTDINAVTGMTIGFWYKNGSGNWIRHAEQTQVPMYYGTTPTALTNGEYSVIRLYVSKDDLNSSTPKFIGVLDANKYSNATQANNAITNGTVRAADTTLAACELAQLGYAIILMNASGGYITSIVPLKQAFGAAFVGGAAATTADLVSVTTTNFNKVLSAADSSVQAALETLDECIGTGTDNYLCRYDGTNKVQQTTILCDDTTNKLSGVLTFERSTTSNTSTDSVTVSNDDVSACCRDDSSRARASLAQAQSGDYLYEQRVFARDNTTSYKMQGLIRWLATANITAVDQATYNICNAAGTALLSVNIGTQATTIGNSGALGAPHKIYSGRVNDDCCEIRNYSTTANQSFGLLTVAGTSVSDYAQKWMAADRTTALGYVRGDGTIRFDRIHTIAGSVAAPVNDTLGNVCSGTWTPTLTNVSNIDSSTVRSGGGTWIRIGNVVHCTVALTIDPTAQPAQCDLGISLPIASNFDNAYQDCIGSGFVDRGVYTSADWVSVGGDTTNDRAQLSWYAQTTANTSVYCWFQYLVK